MTDYADLIRRLGAAVNSKSLHPNYARELLREAREALQGDGSTGVCAGGVTAWYTPSDEEMERLRCIGAITGIQPSALSAFNLSSGGKTIISTDEDTRDETYLTGQHT